MGGRGNGSFLQLLRLRNFRLLWGAGALSAIGDQFDLIAFPWLVLLVTGDPLAVGTVIAVGGIPTVVFMLLGGSLVDRFSPRAIMQVSNFVRIALSVALAALILTGSSELWLIYLFALLKGISDSFFYPAQTAMVPRVVPTERLRQYNALIQTTAELGGFIGPMFAGGLIAFFGNGDGVATLSMAGIPDQEEVAGANLTGIGLAFAIVGVVIFISSLLIALIRLEQPRSELTDQGTKDVGILKSIGEGIKFVRADAAMFTVFLLIVGMELLVEGPVIVGLPILANTKLAEGALALGVVMSAYAGGSLLGSILAGTLPAPRLRFGPILVVLFALSGLLLMPFGLLRSMWIAAAVVLAIGAVDGYTGIMFMSWLQARTPRKLMGRVMSTLSFLWTMTSSTTICRISFRCSGVDVKGGVIWTGEAGASIREWHCKPYHPPPSIELPPTSMEGEAK